MADVLYEVRTAIKQERMEKFWKKYGALVIGCVILIVLSTAVHEGYKAWTADQNKKQSDILFDALSEKEAAQLLKGSETLQDSLRLIAELKSIAILESEKKSEDIVAIYQKIQKNDKIDPEYRQLADYALIRLDQTLNAEQKIAKLSQIWADSNNPWRYHAQLDAAVILANEKKDYKEARAQLANIINAPVAPKTFKQKATSLDILYALFEKDKPAQPDTKQNPSE